MMTLDEIKNISFRKSGMNGYKAIEVDDFVEEVIDLIEQMKKEKSELISKMNVLVTRIEEYRNDEETVRNAFLSSQKTADQVMKDTKVKAEKLIAETNEKIKKLEAESEKKIAIQKKQLLDLQAEASKFRTELIEKYKNHIKLIDSLPNEASVNASKKELDEKFPTNVVLEETHKDENLEETKKVDISKHEQITAIEADEEEQVEENDNKVKVDINFEQAEEQHKDKKFGMLLFGEEYNVKKDKANRK
ncbi:MAG: DivIVA domain-containing protein [Bacillota bacterium]|nr:DivIVA domain-containing protein [Bacillota bacterium]